VIAQQAGARTAFDNTLEDVATGDGTDPRRAEDLPDLDQMVPILVARNTCLISTRPVMSSRFSGASMPESAAFTSSTAS